MAAAVCLSIVLLSGCGKIPPNSVFCCDDLPGKTIGVQKGTTAEDYARKLEESPAEGKPAARVIEYDKGADAVNSLLLGEIDCIITDNEPARLLVSRNRELQVLPDIFLDEYYAIAVNKNTPQLTAELNGVLETLRNDGVISEIVANYIGDHTGSYKYTSPANTERTRGQLVMATNLDFAPYEWEDDNGNPAGIDIDIFYALCDRLGYEPVIKNMKFEEIIPSVHNGETDIGMGALTITADRMEDVDFTQSYAQGVQVIITRKQ